MSPDDHFSKVEDFRQYSKGSLLVLTPHSPPDPYGKNMYRLPPGFQADSFQPTEEEENLNRTQLSFKDKPLNFDPNRKLDEKRQMQLKVIKILGSKRYGPQVVLCQVLKAPVDETSQSLPGNGDLVVAKVYDPLFFRDDDEYDVLEGSHKVTARADMEFSDEVGLYRHLHSKNLTGHPHMAPQFYESWTAEVQSTYTQFRDQTRTVGVLLLEYIQGTHLSDLFYYDECGESIVKPGPVKLHQNGESLLETDEATRLETMRQLMDGRVRQLFVGVCH